MNAADQKKQATPTNALGRRCRAAPIREFLIALLLLGLTVLSAAPGPFSQFVVFGDSLSDVGNIAQATGGIYPGRYYHQNRFSNGPVYVETLASGLRLPMVRSTAGGNNFAYGGAKTSGTGGFDGIFIRDMDEQVDQFLATRATDPNSLFVVFAGSNDLIGGQSNVSIPVNNLAADIGRLIADGAKNILVPNLPWLGYAPRYNGNPTTLSQYNTRTQQFNDALATMLDALETNNPAITLYRFDVAALFNQALADPAAFGLSNVTAAAAPGLQPGASSYNTSQIAANTNEYLFWDDLHPTAAVHQFLAQHALGLLSMPGDFNRDSTVDAADYAVWRKGSGTTYMPDDYNVWRAHFGETSAGSGGSDSAPVPSSNAAAVPEPHGIVLCALALGGAYGMRRMRCAFLA